MNFAAGKRLWKTGLLFACFNLAAALGSYGFQMVMGRLLNVGEYGYANVAIGASLILSAPVSAMGVILIHYIARSCETGDFAAVRTIFSVSRNWILRTSVATALVSAVLSGPLSGWLDFPRQGISLMLALAILVNVGTAFNLAVLSGLGQFTRAGALTFAMAVCKLVLGWILLSVRADAETALSALILSGGMNFAFLPRIERSAEASAPASKWSGSLLRYSLASLASAGASILFTQGDILIAQKLLSAREVGQFCAAGVFPRALLGALAPLLLVLFRSRSAQFSSFALCQQLRTSALYVAFLFAGAAALACLAHTLIAAILGRPDLLATILLPRIALIMVFVGLIQLIGNWALAARWYGLVYLQLFAALAYIAAGLFSKSASVELVLRLQGAAGIGLLLLCGCMGLYVLNAKKLAQAARTQARLSEFPCS